MYVLLLLILLAAPILGQPTAVHLRTQSKSADFASASFTKPFRTGTSLPITCVVGEMFYHSGVPAGTNVYGCTAPDTWSLESGNGNLSAGTFAASASGNALTIGTDCSSALICNVRFTNQVSTLTSSAAATLGSGTSPAGVFVYVDFTTRRITLANSGAAAITCDANCDVLTGSAFPIDSTPLYLWTITNAGAWDTFQTSFDKRALYGTSPATAGGNLTLTVVSGKQTIAYDPTSGLTPTGPLDASGASLTKPNRTVGSDPSGSCSDNNEVVLSGASGNLFSCFSGTWHPQISFIPSVQSGTSYTLADTDRGKQLRFTQNGVVAVTLPTAGVSSQFLAGWCTTFRYIPGPSPSLNNTQLTITPTASTIDGQASLTYSSGQGARVCSDGSNYWTDSISWPLYASDDGSNTVFSNHGIRLSGTAQLSYSEISNTGCTGSPTVGSNGANYVYLELTGDCSPELTAGFGGSPLSVVICQSATSAFTFAWPANVTGGMTISPTLGKCNGQNFIYDDVNSFWRATSAGVIGQ